MYQIFVVEDELLIRQSIRHTVENMQGPYAVCGEASDGEMSLMQELMPDILLTDIRMPFLDGFGLIQHARVMMPWLKIVIISGYGDFESAQKAIALGVDQYLLKPVRPADLVRAIEKLAAQIEEGKGQTELPGGYDKDEVRSALRQHFAQELLYGGADTGTMLERARTLDLDIVRGHYLVAVCFFDAVIPDAAQLRAAVQTVLAQTGMPLYDFNASDQLTVLACDNDPEALTERVYQFIHILRHQLAALCPVITAVVGSPVQRLGAICTAYKTAANLLKRVSRVAAGQVVNVSDAAQVTADIVQFTGPFGDEFQQRLAYAAPDDVPGMLDQVLSSPAGDQLQSMLMRYYALIDLLKMAVQVMARATPAADERDIAAQLSSQYDILASSAQYDSFRDTAERLLRQALSARQEPGTEMRHRSVISRAESYVAANFCDPNISLISVARHVGMSAAHFSTVFSQAMGRSFINYLTALRMERAKQLLTGTNMRLSDIALEIGYNEPNYFSHVFHKTVGMTPKEYRSRGAKEE